MGYEAYRAFSAMLSAFFGTYFLLVLSQSILLRFVDAYSGSAYSIVWSSMMGRIVLLMLVGAVLQFVFALFLQGRNWAVASLVTTGVLCLLGLVLTLVVQLPDYLPAEMLPYAAEARFGCTVMLGMGVPLLQGALSFCRASYKSTVLRFLLVETAWFVLVLLGLYLGVALFAMGIRGVTLTFLGPVAALAVSLALNRRVFRAASRPVPQAVNYQ